MLPRLSKMTSKFRMKQLILEKLTLEGGGSFGACVVVDITIPNCNWSVNLAEKNIAGACAWTTCWGAFS